MAIVLIIALVIFGPKRLPELGKSLGSGMREFKSSISGESDDDDEPRKIEGSATDAHEADDAQATAPAQPTTARVGDAPQASAPSKPAETSSSENPS